MFLFLFQSKSINIKNVDIPYDPNDKLNGAFAYIQRTIGGGSVAPNYIDVQVFSQAQGSDKYNPINYRNEDDNFFWAPSTENNQWFIVDFKESYFYLESYTIRTHLFYKHENFEVYGSNDGINYDIIDQNVRPMPSLLENKYETNNYKCKYPKAKRYFKFVPINKNILSTYNCVLCRLELFGKFVPKLNEKTYHIKLKNIPRFRIFII